MSAVTFTCILMANEGLKLPTAIAYPAGIIFAAGCLGVFVYTCVLKRGSNSETAAMEELFEI